MALFYLPFLLVNGSKGDPVWWSLAVMFAYFSRMDRITVKTLAKAAIPLLALGFLIIQLIRFQQFNRGDIALPIESVMVLTLGARMYGLEGYLMYLEAPGLYNIFYSQLSEILQFLPNADSRPGVTFGQYTIMPTKKDTGISTTIQCLLWHITLVDFSVSFAWVC